MLLNHRLLAGVCSVGGATTTQPLQAGPDPPAEYLCPITQQIMVNPVMLIETGHSYEAASISRWLDLHDTDPMSGQLLHSKQLSSNRALKTLITDWAAAHGIVLPSAPMYTPLSGFTGTPSAPVYTPLPGSDSAPTPAAAAAAAATTAQGASMSHAVLNVPQLEDSSSTNRGELAPLADQQQQQAPDGSFSGPAGKDAAASSFPTARVASGKQHSKPRGLVHPHALGGHRADAAGGGGRSNWGRSGGGRQEVQRYAIGPTCAGATRHVTGFALAPLAVADCLEGSYAPLQVTLTVCQMQ